MCKFKQNQIFRPCRQVIFHWYEEGEGEGERKTGRERKRKEAERERERERTQTGINPSSPAPGHIFSKTGAHASVFTYEP